MPQRERRKYYNSATASLWTRTAPTYFFALGALGARFAFAALAFAFGRGLLGASPLSRARLAAGNFGIACLAQGHLWENDEKGTLENEAMGCNMFLPF